MKDNYTNINSSVIDSWVEDGWEWSLPISAEEFKKAQNGEWSVVLTPIKPVPHDWFCDLKDANVLGLASGGGQQMPIFAACGAKCTVLDYSELQLNQERIVAEREGYDINIVKADMTKPLPFEDGSFDLIFHPVSNCYIEDVLHVWRECYRVLKKGGILLAGFSNCVNYFLDDEGERAVHALPYNPLKDEKLYEEAMKSNSGIQFSHTIDEQIGGQLKAGFTLSDIFEDTNSSGHLHDLNVPCFYATRSIKS